MTAGLALFAGGCSLSLHLASLQIDPEKTGAITRTVSPLDSSLNDEDWRRAQAALSLAVDPQGSGQSVSWDNPASKRKGSFAAAGNLILVDNIVCRPFVATVSQLGQPSRESRHTGRACRVGPGEWAMRDVAPVSLDTTARLPQGGVKGLGESRETLQPLPAPTTSILEARASEP